MTDNCDYASTLYCAATYGDLVVARQGLDSRPVGFFSTVMGGIALGSLVSLVLAVRVGGRRGREGFVVPGPDSAQESSATAASPGSRTMKACGTTCRNCAGSADGIVPGEGDEKDAGSDASSGKDCCGHNGGPSEDNESTAGNKAGTDSGRRSIINAGRALSSSFRSSGTVSQGNTKAFAILVQQEEQRRSASLKSTASIIAEEKQMRSASLRAATEQEKRQGDFSQRITTTAVPSSPTRRNSLLVAHKIRWPSFSNSGRDGGRTIPDQFPSSSEGSPLSSFSFRSSTLSDPRFSDDDGADTVSPTGRKSSTTITAKALAEAFDEPGSPLGVSHELGGWWQYTGDGGFEGQSALSHFAAGGGIAVAQSSLDPGQADGGGLIHSVKAMPPADVARAAAAATTGGAQHLDTTTTADPEPHDFPLIRRAAVALAGMGARGRMFAASRPRSTFLSQVVETPPLSVLTSSSTATSSGIGSVEVFDNAHRTDFATSARLGAIAGSPQDEEEQRRQWPKKAAHAGSGNSSGNADKLSTHLQVDPPPQPACGDQDDHHPKQHQQLHQSQQREADMYPPFVARLDELTSPGGLCDLLESPQNVPEPQLSARAKASPMGSASPSPPFTEPSPAGTSVSSCESGPRPTPHFF
ncbi:hypothetical protein Esi_0219_0003 [Ectocarpus siliculosus]|uniref:Uncharacterized protein n=1 Tax=Ectocarpus siliculosus TaxID=2880 RepID=D7FRS7_ECTSI|nr:hypothetical protein Esi_0219_0003 [Ectocarpus siliculosus]|eukprot:CBJ30868.1 hypothetical protein Esi_0219_0003 [Ectocarpus siliculosus]